LAIWNLPHVLHALNEFESFYDQYRPHRTLHGAAPLQPAPEPINEPDRLHRLDVHRHDRLSGHPPRVCKHHLTCPDVIIGTRNLGHPQCRRSAPKDPESIEILKEASGTDV
jgi:hypothetical protein